MLPCVQENQNSDTAYLGNFKSSINLMVMALEIKQLGADTSWFYKPPEDVSRRANMEKLSDWCWIHVLISWQTALEWEVSLPMSWTLTLRPLQGWSPTSSRAAQDRIIPVCASQPPWRTQQGLASQNYVTSQTTRAWEILTESNPTACRCEVTS